DSITDDLAGEDIDDRVHLVRNPMPDRLHIGDVPTPYLPRTGRDQHRLDPRCPRPGPGRHQRTLRLVDDRFSDAPPGPPGCQHHTLVPGPSERVIHRVVTEPTSMNAVFDELPIGSIDASGIVPLLM